MTRAYRDGFIPEVQDDRFRAVCAEVGAICIEKLFEIGVRRDLEELLVVALVVDAENQQIRFRCHAARLGSWEVVI